MSEAPETIEERLAKLEAIVATLVERAKNDDDSLELLFTAPKR